MVGSSVGTSGKRAGSLVQRLPLDHPLSHHVVICTPLEDPHTTRAYGAEKIGHEALNGRPTCRGGLVC